MPDEYIIGHLSNHLFTTNQAKKSDFFSPGYVLACKRQMPLIWSSQAENSAKHNGLTMTSAYCVM
jgi:hypothetical protein